MNTQSGTHLRGPVQVVVRAIWLGLVLPILAAFASAVPVRFGQLLNVVTGSTPDSLGQIIGMSAELEAVVSSRLGPAEAGVLHRLGLSLGFYAGYILTFEVMLALACAVIGIFIFWRKSDDWMALWVSLVLILVGTNGVSQVAPALATVWPGGLVLLTLVGILGMVSLPHVLFLSPDGQFVPRWTLLIAAGCTGGTLAFGVYILVGNQSVGIASSVLPVFLLWTGVNGLGFFNQVYRYMRVSGPVQRQQTKWMVIGMGAVALGLVLNFIFLSVPLQPGLPRLLFYLARAPVITFCMVLLPVCLAFSIFRYRLWDIDVIIRRTLQYSLLSGLLALVYFSLIIVLQSIFTATTGQTQSPFVTVLSTLAIAALFSTLRARVQDFIDRRFFRRKYDAQKVLAEFAATARDETDLDKLTARLAEVVKETMQPEKVSLWLKDSNAKSQRHEDGK